MNDLQHFLLNIHQVPSDTFIITNSQPSLYASLQRMAYLPKIFGVHAQFFGVHGVQQQTLVNGVQPRVQQEEFRVLCLLNRLWVVSIQGEKNYI